MSSAPTDEAVENPKGNERGLWDQTICTIHAALTPVGSELKQDKVVHRKIRMQVLDCRSGKPIQNKHVDEVSLDGGEAVRLLNTGGWDFVQNYVIPANAQGPLDWTGFGPTKKNPKGSTQNLQKALESLGFPSGKSNKNMTDAAWNALEAYQTAWYASKEQSGPAKFTKAIDTVWVQRIVAEYNEKFHRAVQVELTGLGYDCQSDDGQWRTTSENALAKWQKIELGTNNPFTTFNSGKNLEARKNLAKKLQEAKKHFFTDAEGVIHIDVPVAKIRSGFKLKISFHDFAMVLERAGFSRDLPTQAPTHFAVEWQDGTQDQKSGSWCWRLRPHFNTDARSSLPEFRSFLEMNVPAIPTGSVSCSWRHLDQSARDTAQFSPFYAGSLYENLGDQPEFVAFALVWCQVVFDDIDDPSEPHNISSKAYIDPEFSKEVRASVRGRHVHLVTLALPLGGKPHAGKGYGKIERLNSPPTKWRNEFGSGQYGHPGIDLYASVGLKIFALHAGKAHRNINSSGGQNVCVSWEGLSITCLHFSEFLVSNGAFVKAGELIGLAGRTGNFSSDYDIANPTNAPPSKYPGHTHLNIHVHDYDSSLHEAIVQQDPDNAICLATNDTPLVFPCVCEVTLPELDPSHCNFADAKFTDSCWAVAELKCPYMWNAGGGQSPFRLQAQLRYLYDNQADGDGYLNPGPVDGKIGKLPTAANTYASPTRKAIRAFLAKHEQEDGYDMNDAAWTKLNELAKIEEPQTEGTS